LGEWNAAAGTVEERERLIAALIPARGDSRRLPEKACGLFAGEPLIVTTIRQALEVQRIDRVVVSTDDPGIAEVSRSVGAEILIRPASLATDESPTGVVLAHALDELQDRVDLIVTMHPTNPLRPSDTIRRAIGLFEQIRPGSVVSVSASSSKRRRVVREAPVFGVPSINVGTRQRRRSSSRSIVDVPAEREAIIDAMSSLPSEHEPSFPFGRGDSARRFPEALHDPAFWEPPKQKQFQDLDRA
jgi:CMP-2-keto-3-deoxyoctulosonic acid synthetase